MTLSVLEECQSCGLTVELGAPCACPTAPATSLHQALEQAAEVNGHEGIDVEQLLAEPPRVIPELADMLRRRLATNGHHVELKPGGALADVVTHEVRLCECCGRSPAEYFESLGLYVCADCDLPENQPITQIEVQAWHAVLRFAAGKRKIGELRGNPVSMWFFERYERLGLNR